ncbi:MAG: alpha-mannosidase, partial [Gemmatimonadota bacterium]
VPEAFAGLVLDLYPMGLGAGASYAVLGEGTRSWEAGRVALCGPCVAGDALALRIEPDGSRPLWATPVVRVRDAGFAEYADGYGYAVALTGRPPPIEAPDPAEFLAAMGAGDGGTTYAALLDRYRRAYEPQAAEIRRDTLRLIGNSHIDAAWLWRWDETMGVIENTWRTSLKLAEMFPGYIFAGSSAAYYEMLDHEAPGLADSLVAATQANVWVPVGGWWVEPDYNMPAGESLVRQGLYGQRYFERRYGRRSTVAWTPDSFGYPWTVPQILRGSGFESFVTQKVRWNDSTTFPHNAWFWKGRDGTEIFSYNPYSYVHDLNPDRLVSERLEDRERTGGHEQIVLYGVGDHGGGPTIEMLQRREDAARIPTFPAMKFASPETALNRVELGLPRDSFATWDDELYLEYHRGTYTTQAEIKRRNRRSESMLRTVEPLAALALPAAAYPREAIESAWRQVLFNQFHDILPGSGIPEIYVDAKATYDSAAATLGTLTEAAFDALAAQFHTEAAALGSENALVVYNPLGWPRSGTIEVVSGADTIRQHVDAVPPFGAQAVPLVTGDLPGTPPTTGEPGENWLENDFLRVEFDPTGVVTRIYDKQRGVEALRPGGRANVLQMFDDRPNEWDAWNIVTWKESWEVTDTRSAPEVRADDHVAEAVFVRSWGESTIRQTLRLSRDLPWLEIENDIDWREEHKALKAAVEPLASPDSATYEIPYGTIGRSGRPRTQLERAKFEVPGQRWADVSGAHGGLAVLNDSKYGWDYRNGTLRLTLLRSPTWPDSLADRGTHNFRFALWPHAGSWKDADVHRRAAEYNTPLLARLEPAHPGSIDGAGLGVLRGGDGGDPRGVNLEWAKRAEDSDAIVFRVVEWFGQAADAALVTNCARPRAFRANLLEDRGDALLTRGPRIMFSLRPYEIATLIVECDE